MPLVQLIGSPADLINFIHGFSRNGDRVFQTEGHEGEIRAGQLQQEIRELGGDLSTPAAADLPDQAAKSNTREGVWDALLLQAMANRAQSEANLFQAKANEALSQNLLHCTQGVFDKEGTIDLEPDRLESWYAAHGDAVDGCSIARLVTEQAQGFAGNDVQHDEHIPQCAAPALWKCAIGSKRRVPSVLELLKGESGGQRGRSRSSGRAGHLHGDNEEPVPPPSSKPRPGATPTAPEVPAPPAHREMARAAVLGSASSSDLRALGKPKKSQRKQDGAATSSSIHCQMSNIIMDTIVQGMGGNPSAATVKQEPVDK